MASRLEQMTARMVDAADVSTDFYGMIYGDIGVGKTLFAVRLAQVITPDDRGILFLDTRRGFSVLNDHPDLKNGVVRLKVDGPDDLATLAQAIVGGVEPYTYVSTVIIDELNVLAADSLSRVVRERTMTPKDQIITAVPEWPDFNANQNIIGSAVAALTGIDGLNFIAVSGDKATKDNQGIEKHRADINPGLAKILQRDMHLVARMEAAVLKTDKDAPAEYSRTLQINPTVRIEAKTRISGLPVKVSDDSLIDTIANWLDNSEQMRADQTVRDTTELSDDDLPGTETGEPLPESDDEVYSAPMDE